MKILYAIQGTGNGHIARAEEIVPVLQKYANLDVFISGAQSNLKLPYPVKYKSKGLSFYFGKSGGIDLIKTFKYNSSKALYKEIKTFPVEKYDLVINDFELISAWACRRKNIPCLALSHQSALLSPKVIKPKEYDLVGDWVLKNYAPADEHISFHFARYDQNIFTPVIRSRIRKAQVETKPHYTVYLPAYDDLKLVPLLLRFPRIQWHVFSKHTTRSYHIGKLSVYPVSNEEFTISMASATAVLCGAGFETPAEALYLGKKLMVVPMKLQYEQQYNAAALKQLGVPVLKKVKKKYLDKIGEWIENNDRLTVNYEDIADEAVQAALNTGLKK